MVNITIYVEGGPNNSSDTSAQTIDNSAVFREGFHRLFSQKLGDYNFNLMIQPIGPISNPGAVAIDAAFNPTEGPWLFFVTVNLTTGETVFTETAAEHEAAVEQYYAWLEAHPEAVG